MKDSDSIIFEFLEDLLGEGGVEIASIISTKESTAEELAEEIDMKINNVRKVLYKLYDHRLASYRRTRDKTTGWYIYFWKLNIDNAPSIVKNIETNYLKKLEDNLQYETASMYFICKNSCQRLSFEDAQEINFICPVCGEILEFFDNSKIISRIQEEIKDIKHKKAETA
ncbi:MAG: transcription factor E [Candidatus Methanofastidiosia archaeon]